MLSEPLQFQNNWQKQHTPCRTSYNSLCYCIIHAIVLFQIGSIGVYIKLKRYVLITYDACYRGNAESKGQKVRREEINTK